MTFTCHRCGKEIGQKDLVAVELRLRIRPFHRTCFADVLKDDFFGREYTVVNSPQGRMHYYLAYALLILAGVLCTVLAVAAALKGNALSAVIYVAVGLLYAVFSIYYIRNYRKYAKILGPQPLPEEMQKRQAARAPAQKAPLPPDAVVCAYCEKQVMTRADLVVAYSGKMPRSGIFPFHKECFVTKSQSSLWTSDWAINSPRYIFAAIIIGIAFLFALSGVMAGENSPVILLFILAAGFFAIGPRWYVYNRYERKLPR